MEIIYREIESLKKAENNPRTISEEQLLKLQKSIQDNPDYFEARPIILSDRIGVLMIIAGNQRYEACVRLGMKEVPTVLISNLTEEKEREIMVRDNVNNGEWDNAKLVDWNFDELKDWGVDLPSDLGINQDEYGDTFSLPNEDKLIQQMTFTFSEQQAKLIKRCIASIANGLPNSILGNENKNGNSLYEICREWEERKKL